MGVMFLGLLDGTERLEFTFSSGKQGDSGDRSLSRASAAPPSAPLPPRETPTALRKLTETKERVAV